MDRLRGSPSRAHGQNHCGTSRDNVTAGENTFSRCALGHRVSFDVIPLRSGAPGKSSRPLRSCLPASRADTIGERRRTHLLDKTCGLVFPTSGCNPKLNFLDDLKACAERAKLKKEDFWLHKFRATFATWSLWAGVDLRTVQLIHLLPKATSSTSMSVMALRTE